MLIHLPGQLILALQYAIVNIVYTSYPTNHLVLQHIIVSIREIRMGQIALSIPVVKEM